MGILLTWDSSSSSSIPPPQPLSPSPHLKGCEGPGEELGQGSSESLALDMAGPSVDPPMTPFHSFSHQQPFAEYVPHKDMNLGTSFLTLALGPVDTQPG